MVSVLLLTVPIILSLWGAIKKFQDSCCCSWMEGDIVISTQQGWKVDNFDESICQVMLCCQNWGLCYPCFCDHVYVPMCSIMISLLAWNLSRVNIRFYAKFGKVATEIIEHFSRFIAKKQWAGQGVLSGTCTSRTEHHWRLMWGQHNFQKLIKSVSGLSDHYQVLTLSIYHLEQFR